MKITVTGRHMNVSDVVREYAYGKSERLTRFFENIQRVEIILNPEKDGRYSAEMIVHAPRGSILVCHTTDKTTTAALDAVLDRVERQLTKLKDKLRRRNGHGGGALKATPSRLDEGTASDDSGDLWW